MTSRRQLLIHGAWFYLLNTLVLLMIGCRYFQYFTDLTGLITYFYLFITTLSHFALLSFIPYLILYVPTVVIFSQRTIAWIVAGISGALMAIFLLIDSFVFNLYRFHINRFVFELLFGGGGSQIFEFHSIQYIMVIFGTLLFFCVMLFLAYKIINWHQLLSVRLGRCIVMTLLAFMAMGHCIHIWADAYGYFNITKTSRYYPLYFPATGKSLMAKLGVKRVESNMLSMNEKATDMNYPLHPVVTDSIDRKNVVFILLDSWNPRALDSLAMPNIYRFSKECEVYQHHYSGSNGTRTGLFSIFYSIPGIYWNSVLASQTSPVLMDVLQANQYHIETFPSAPLTNPPFDRTIFSKVKWIELETVGEKASDRDMAITQKWLQARSQKVEGNQPLFSFLFYDALHAMSHPKQMCPFQPEWEYVKYELLNNDIDATPFLNLYKNTAYYVDSLVGVVLNDLKRRGMYENTWIVITGDHSQEFNENKKNYWGHNSNYSSAQLQVPFMIHRPNVPPRVYNHWTCHFDIVPTIMHEMMNCKNPIGDYSLGKCLNDTTERKWILAGSYDNYAIVEPEKIISVSFDGSFEVTDSHLNDLGVQRMNTQLINSVLMQSKVYFK